jgi:hypothetical protein
MKIAISPDAVNRPETELDDVRRRFGRFLVVLLWAHVPLLVTVAWLAGQSPLGAGAAGAVLALAYHLMWWQQGIARATRYLSAVALVGEPALLLFLMQGHAWQMDMHMYFFAMLALTIAWCDRGAILMAATATALHHLVLLYALPYAVFPARATLRVSCSMRSSLPSRRRCWCGSATGWSNPCSASPPWARKSAPRTWRWKSARARRKTPRAPRACSLPT